MTEAMVINSFFILRVFIVGGLLIFLPRLMRKGILFGVYIGEEPVKQEKISQLRINWVRDCIFVILISLLIGLGISLAGWPLAGNLTGTVVLLSAAFALYVIYYLKARKSIPTEVARQAQKSVASLGSQNQSGLFTARIILGICLAVCVMTILYAMVLYNQVSESLSPDTPAYKVFINYMFFPLFSLLFSSVLGFLAVFSAVAKRSLRERTDEQSIQAQDSFRIFFTRMLSYMAVLFCTTSTFLSIQIFRFGTFEITQVGVETWLSLAMLIIVIFTSFVRLIVSYGQGGALREHGSVDMPLTGSLTDNTHWVLGLFYIDRNDPSLIVEKRFGFGFTLNYGNVRAVIFTFIHLSLLITLIIMAMLRFAT